MPGLDTLLNLTGNWRGSYKLFLSPGEPADESASRAAVRAIALGRFVAIDYTWMYDGKAQGGTILIGHQQRNGTITEHWVDSFHMSDVVMTCSGATKPGGGVDVLGTYAAPPGQDWGWRTVIDPKGKTGFRIRMYNIAPGGPEEIAVDAVYLRTKAATPRRLSARRKPRTRSRPRRRS